LGAVLLKGGVVLSQSRRVGNHVQADVLLQDGRVAEVGPGLRARDAEVIDATDMIVMPGFVDAHRHGWRSLLRNLDGEETPETVLRRTGPRFGPDEVYAATLLSLVSAAEAGVTTAVDWSDIQVDAATFDASLQAHADAGLRTVFVPVAPAWADGVPDPLAMARRVTSDAATRVPATTTLAFGSADLVRGGQEFRSSWRRARELGLRIHVHAGLSRDARGLVGDVAARGDLGPDVTVVHGTHLDDHDLDAIASNDVGLAVAPTMEMASGLGIPPLQALIDRGIRPGLATEDQLVSPGDLFAQMRSAQSVQHAASFARKLGGEGSVPRLLTTREVLRYATVDGAVVAGLGEVTGCLEPGRQADVVLLRTDRPNIAPVNDPIGAVVWGMDASNVDTVFVAGRPLVRGGAVVADESHIRALALAARERLEVDDRSVTVLEGGRG
jgi:5-methylthioadenosine/S-adenosylhomocysteine deaminase